MKQLHKNKWLLIGLILTTIFSSLGTSISVIAETLDFSTVESTETSENTNLSSESDVTTTTSFESIKESTTLSSDENQVESSSEEVPEANNYEKTEDKQSKALSFNPPARGDVGGRIKEFSATSTIQRREEIKKNKIPEIYGKDLELSIDKELGGEPGEKIEFELNKNSKVHLWWDWYDTYDKESYYGFIRLKNLRISANSDYISTSVEELSNGNFKVTINREKKDDVSSYDLNISYDYDFEYYTSYYATMNGSWSDWISPTTEYIKSVTTTIPIKAVPTEKEIDWGNSIIFGTNEKNDTKGKSPFNTGSVITTSGENNNIDDMSRGTAEGRERIDIDREDNLLSYSFDMGAINQSTGYFQSSGIKIEAMAYQIVSQQQGKITGGNGNGFEYGDGIVKAYSSITMKDGSRQPRIRRTQGTKIYDDVKDGMNEVYYEIYRGNYYPLNINKLDIAEDKTRLKKGAVKSEIDELLLESNKVISNTSYSDVKKVQIKKYPDTSKIGETQATIQVEQTLKSGKKMSFDYVLDFIVEEDKVITAKPVPTDIPLGTDIDNVSPYELVTDVKLGNQTLSKDDYTVSVQNSLSTDTVGNRTAKALVTYKKDTNKTLSLDVPVNILWGNSIVYGGYDYGGNGRTTAAFTLNNGDNPSINAAQGGTRDDNLAIHSNFPNEQYYTFNWFDLSNKQTLLMTEEQKGTSYIQANGNDLKKDKLSEWGVNQKQEVNYGDVVRAWQLETDKNWLYENEQKNSYNEGMQSVYYEITQTGYKPLTFNQATINKRTISIDESDKEIEDKISESIELPNGVTAKFIEYPKREKQGDAQGIVRVSETLQSGKIVEYDYTVPFEVIDDRLVTAKAVPTDIPLGTDIDSVPPYELVTDVKLGNQTLNKDDYTVSVQNSVSTDTVGNRTAKALVTYKKDTSKTLSLDVPVKIIWGDSIHLRGGYSKSVLALSLINDSDNLEIRASKGENAASGSIHETKGKYFGIDLYSLNNSLLENYYSKSIDGSSNLTNVYKEVKSPIKVNEGDIIKIYHKQIRGYPGLLEVYTDSAKGMPNSDKHMINEDLYFEITSDGFKLLNINQFQTNNSNIVPLNTTKEEMDSSISNYLSMPKNETSPQNYRMEFNGVSTSSSGKKSDTISVYQMLQSGKEFKLDYSVNYTVNPEIEETDYDVEGNKISETKKTSFDYGTQFKSSPTKYLEKNDNLYVYKGWLENVEVPGVDIPKEGIPSPTEKESKFYYIYEKADKYINVTIPTEIVFGTFDNTEEVKSNKYEIKNNSKELTTNVSLDSFREVKTSVKLLGENETPDEIKDSARLNLLINDETKIKGLNEAKFNIPLADIEPENTANMGINGEYYAKTSKINIVEYNTILKFKAVSGK